MKNSFRYGLVILLAFQTTVVLAQSIIPNIAVGARQDGNCIKISWTSGLEVGIDHYEVYRSTEQTGSFADCIQDNVRCKGNGQGYEVADTRDLFKTVGKNFYYQVKAVDASGIVVAATNHPVFTNYNSTSSTAKRTWGSIKAMFR
jgi:hypothetical protein